jgi:hypothetical protein
MPQLDAGGLHEHLHGDMGSAVEAGGAEDDLAGLLLRVVHEVLEGLPRGVGADDEHGWVGVDPGDARELIARVVRRAPEELVDLGEHGDADKGHEQRVTVGLARGDRLVPHRAGRSCLVDDGHRLLQDALERRGHRARRVVRDAARGKGDHHGDRPRGVGILRPSHAHRHRDDQYGHLERSKHLHLLRVE